MHGIQADMLSDRDLVVTDAFGLRNTAIHSGPGSVEALPVPATLLVDAQGIVRWIRKPSENALLPGVGVEVIHVDRDCMDFYLQLVEDLLTEATIPLCA